MSGKETWADRFAGSIGATDEWTNWPTSDSIDELIRDATPEPAWQLGTGDAEEVHRLFQVGLRGVVGVAVREAVYRLEEIFYMCESPIEQAMLMALVASAKGRGDGVVVKAPDAERRQGQRFDVGDGGLTRLLVEVQKPIGNYRVDFLLTSEWLEPPVGRASIVVECDGHDYHERTKQQASKDRRRDRALQSLGFRVFRFTGSDIWRDIASCAYDATVEVGHAAYQKHKELWGAQ